LQSVEDFQKLQKYGASYNKASSTTAAVTHGYLIRQVVLQLEFDGARQKYEVDDKGERVLKPKLDYEEFWRVYDLYVDPVEVYHFLTLVCKKRTCV
jgi:hypothetical protein